MKRFAGLTAALLLCACTIQTYRATQITDDSGETFRALSVTPVQAPAGTPAAAMLRYQSHTDFSDIRSLHREALRVWGSFRARVKRSEYKMAVITAVPKDANLNMPARGYNFVFQLQNGVWHETDMAAHT